MGSRAIHPADRRFSVAPMMGHSHGPARRMWRRLLDRGVLYTPMIAADAAVRRERLLAFDPAERPLALQLGGNDPALLARCARLAEAHGFDEVNLNAGCPSDRVRQGGFGACMMADPGLIGDCARAMRDACGIAVTVKTRIAIDHMDPGACLDRVADALSRAGADAVIVHARKAWTKGLNPKANRTVPPLDHDRVARLKRDFPGLAVVANGGICDTEGAARILRGVDGVMCGREVVRRPLFLQEIAAQLWGQPPARTREEVVRLTIEDALGSGRDWRKSLTAMLGLHHGLPGGRRFRQALAAAPSPAKAAATLERLGFA